MRTTATTARRAVVGLGSNLGDREEQLRAALKSLGELPGTRVLRASAWIETAPVGPVPQGPFLNGAALLETSLAPRELLDALLAIEHALGRVRTVRWGPRTIDLDVLWIEGLVVDEPGLRVPHPELLHRPFALAPLAEVCPEAVDPRTGARLAQGQGAATLAG